MGPGAIFKVGRCGPCLPVEAHFLDPPVFHASWHWIFFWCSSVFFFDWKTFLVGFFDCWWGMTLFFEWLKWGWKVVFFFWYVMDGYRETTAIFREAFFCWHKSISRHFRSPTLFVFFLQNHQCVVFRLLISSLVSHHDWLCLEKKGVSDFADVLNYCVCWRGRGVYQA